MHLWDATEPIGLAASHYPSKAVQHEGGAFPWSERNKIFNLGQRSTAASIIKASLEILILLLLDRAKT